MENKSEFLTKQEFDLQYRPVTAEHFYPEIEYFHKLESAEGYKAVPAGIHENPGFNQTQFEADAWHGLAYLPADKVFDVEKAIPDRPVDGIMKEGKLIDAATVPEAKKHKAKSTKKKPSAKDENTGIAGNTESSITPGEEK